jgi:hypothetical protein
MNSSAARAFGYLMLLKYLGDEGTLFPLICLSGEVFSPSSSSPAEKIGFRASSSCVLMLVLPLKMPA